MAKQTVLVGTAPDDGTGDPVRSAFTKVNSNFTELYTGTDLSNVVAGDLLYGIGPGQLARLSHPAWPGGSCSRLRRATSGRCRARTW